MVGLGVCEAAGGQWRWTLSGLLEYGGAEGGCLTSLSGQKETVLSPCDDSREDQMVEVGLEVNIDGEDKIAPISEDHWQARMKSRRTKELEQSRLEVQDVLTEIRELKRTGALERQTGSRRAVVFYVDKGEQVTCRISRLSFTFQGGASWIAWWIYAWKLIGLDTPEEAFDIIIFSHPDSVSSLPADCQEMREDFSPSLGGPGQCLYRRLVPFSERNSKYYNHLNSLECLYNNESSAFLTGYKTLLRADLDTMPTPALAGYWPEDLVAHRGAHTTWHLETIEAAIRSSAAAAGIKHRHWHNIDSSLMGPSIRQGLLLSKYCREHSRSEKQVEM